VKVYCPNITGNIDNGCSSLDSLDSGTLKIVFICYRDAQGDKISAAIVAVTGIFAKTTSQCKRTLRMMEL